MLHTQSTGLPSLKLYPSSRASGHFARSKVIFRPIPISSPGSIWFFLLAVWSPNYFNWEFFFSRKKDIASPSEVTMIKMRDENIGERSKRVNSSPYFHRGRMSCILITSKMIMWNQGNISLQKKNDSIDQYFPNETQTRQVFCVFAVFWSPRFAHVAFIFVLALDAAEGKVLLFSLQAPCSCFPRKATLN